MESMDQDEEQGLTTCESLIMKVLWENGGDLSAIELREKLKDRFGKDYTRTTMATFLLKLTAKGFVKSRRVGRNSYVHAVKTEEAYTEKLLKDGTDFWFSGKAANMVSALFHSQKLTKEDVDEIRRILDGMDH